MKKFTSLFVLAIVLFSISSFAQMPAAISISPANATAYDEITLTFDPAQACFETATLVGSATVAMHSGVIPINGSLSNWQHIVAFDAVGSNGASPDFIDNGDGTFSFTYIPKEFYGFPAGTIITHIVAVFNNGSNWNNDGRDDDPAGGCMDFAIPLSYTTTAPSILFNVNMNKQIEDGNFDPATENVYTIIQGMDSLLLENSLDTNSNPTNIYMGEITTGLSEGDTIDFHFRMNNTDEILNRSLVLSLGQNLVDVWFNDITSFVLTLNCDMSYYVAEGLFDPSNQYLDVAGNFNNWNGVGHQLDDTDGDNNYSITIGNLNPGKLEFKFRIDGSWDDATCEFPNSGPDRILMLATGGFDYQAIYNNYMPGAMPVTFICRMNYQIDAGNFDPFTDFLGLSGNFNSWTGNVQLADRDGQQAFSLNIPIDITTSPNIEFNFSINNNAETTEGFIRNYTVLDTAGGGIENIIDVWFNNDNPAIGSLPRANNAKIFGTLEIGEQLSAYYEYEDVNGDLEGATTYLWAIADDTAGTNMNIISDGATDTYTIVQADLEKYIFLDIRPVSLTISGSDSVGTMYGDTIKLKDGPVRPVSISTTETENFRIFPNPTSGIIYIENLNDVDLIEIINIDGKLVNSINPDGKSDLSIDTGILQAGIYFVSFSKNKKVISSEKLVKQ
ncbi:MAG: T9SS type A sorting domain-containing protein [Bacteroidota bacterium]|nr:T9SS type A sorting domain-containing protein [Bacteroidota bacterium]